MIHSPSGFYSETAIFLRSLISRSYQLIKHVQDVKLNRASFGVKSVSPRIYSAMPAVL